MHQRYYPRGLFARKRFPERGLRLDALAACQLKSPGGAVWRTSPGIRAGRRGNQWIIKETNVVHLNVLLAVGSQHWMQEHVAAARFLTRQLR